MLQDENVRARLQQSASIRVLANCLQVVVNESKWVVALSLAKLLGALSKSAMESQHMGVQRNYWSRPHSILMAVFDEHQLPALVFLILRHYCEQDDIMNANLHILPTLLQSVAFTCCHSGEPVQQPWLHKPITDPSKSHNEDGKRVCNKSIDDLLWEEACNAWTQEVARCIASHSTGIFSATVCTS